MGSQLENRLRFLRGREVDNVAGFSPATRYRQINEGTFVPGIATSGRMKRWNESEVTAVNAARLAGKSDDYMRSLVTWLIDQRANTAASLLPPDELVLGGANTS